MQWLPYVSASAALACSAFHMNVNLLFAGECGTKGAVMRQVSIYRETVKLRQ
jgi:hypothetical protein